MQFSYLHCLLVFWRECQRKCMLVQSLYLQMLMASWHLNANNDVDQCGVCPGRLLKIWHLNANGNVAQYGVCLHDLLEIWNLNANGDIV